MIEIHIPVTELWDEKSQEFININKPLTIQMEHSLVSISKWEAKWHKPFLVKYPKKTIDEVMSYLECMLLTKNVNPKVVYAIPKSEMERINAYIEDPMTARQKSDNGKRSREVITSELIYYWMITYNIPPEYRKWHINRLMSLIEVCNIKNTPPKKISAMEKYNHYKALNEARRKKWGTKG